MADTAYDLTPTITKYLDKHLIIPLLQWHLSKDDPAYAPRSLVKSLLKVVEQTKMVEFRNDLANDIEGLDETPADREADAQRVLDELEVVADDSSRLFHALKDADRDQVTIEKLDRFLKCIRFRIECAQYAPEQQVAEHLQLYLDRIQSLGGLQTVDKELSARWGLLLACILQAQWAEDKDDDVWTPAVGAFQDLENVLESRRYQDQLTLLTQRTWLMHWSLFVHYNTGDGHNMLISFFVKEHWLNVIQTSCPHLLRYLAASLIIDGERTSLMDDKALRVIQEEQEYYSDPITEFLRRLRGDFDFVGAEQALRECADVLDQDFFLNFYKDDFLESARYLYFRTFCSVHHRVDMTDLAKRLFLDFRTPQECEEYFIKFIEKSELDAKIDSQQNHIVLATDITNPQELVLGKTKTIDRRFEEMVTQLAKKARQ